MPEYVSPDSEMYKPINQPSALEKLLKENRENADQNRITPPKEIGQTEK